VAAAQLIDDRVSYGMISAVTALDSALGLRATDPGRDLRGTVRVSAGRRDRHGCLQRDAGVLAAHRATVNQPAAIRLVLGYGYAWAAGLKVRGEATAIARWPDHNASVAPPGGRSRPTRGAPVATRADNWPRLAQASLAHAHTMAFPR
jgi:hypothetical protein